MIFSNQQIQEILDILKRWELVFICDQLGTDFFSAGDKAILRAAGIDLKKYKNKKGIVEHAYLFGILSEALGDARAAAMNYDQFKRFLASGNFVPLTEAEEFALDQLKNRAYTDISGLGSRIKQGTTNAVVRANLQQQNVVRDLVKKQAIKAVELRIAPTGLASDLANLTEDWGRDWLRIAYYLMHEAYNSGRAQSILKNHGGDAEVYFDVFPGACKHCKELLLEDPDDPQSKPKVFKLKDLIANGNNIGRKVAEWLPTISPIHPYCRCIINFKRPGYEWDEDLRAFTKPAKIQPKNPKLQNVKLNIKVSKADDNDFEKAEVNMDAYDYDPHKILGANWTARKDYVEALRVWGNFIAGTPLVNLFNDDKVWSYVQSALYRKYGNSPGTASLQCSVRQLVTVYLRTAWESGNVQVKNAYNAGKYKTLFGSLIKRKKKMTKKAKSTRKTVVTYPVSSQEVKERNMTSEDMAREFDEVFNKR